MIDDHSNTSQKPPSSNDADDQKKDPKAAADSLKAAPLKSTETKKTATANPNTRKTATESKPTLTPVPQTEPEKLFLPVVPIREGVLFPSTESVLTFGRIISVEAVHEAKRTKNLVILLSQK